MASTPPPLVDAAEAGAGRLLLVLVAAMFASMTVAIRFVFVQDAPPSASVLSAIRGLMAALCFTPLLVSRAASLKQAPPGFWRAVGELAFLNVGFQSLLNAAVLYTDATRAGFLFQGCVVFTPLLCVLSGRPVTLTTWLAAGAAALGVALLGVLLLGETCSPAGWMGGAVIVAAVATASGGLDAFKPSRRGE